MVFNGFSMSFQWVFKGVQWVFNGFSMGFQWVFNEFSMGFQWVFKGFQWFSMGFSRFSRVGRPVEYGKHSSKWRFGAKKSSGI